MGKANRRAAVLERQLARRRRRRERKAAAQVGRAMDGKWHTARAFAAELWIDGLKVAPITSLSIRYDAPGEATISGEMGTVDDLSYTFGDDDEP